MISKSEANSLEVLSAVIFLKQRNQRVFLDDKSSPDKEFVKKAIKNFSKVYYKNIRTELVSNIFLV